MVSQPASEKSNEEIRQRCPGRNQSLTYGNARRMGTLHPKMLATSRTLRVGRGYWQVPREAHYSTAPHDTSQPQQGFRLSTGLTSTPNSSRSEVFLTATHFAAARRLSDSLTARCTTAVALTTRRCKKEQERYHVWSELLAHSAHGRPWSKARSYDLSGGCG